MSKISRNHRIVSVWLPASVVAEIDSRVARISRAPGARASRNAWIADVVKSALAAEPEATAAEVRS